MIQVKHTHNSACGQFWYGPSAQYLQSAQFPFRPKLGVLLIRKLPSGTEHKTEVKTAGSEMPNMEMFTNCKRRRRRRRQYWVCCFWWYAVVLWWPLVSTFGQWSSAFGCTVRCLRLIQKCTKSAYAKKTGLTNTHTCLHTKIPILTPIQGPNACYRLIIILILIAVVVVVVNGFSGGASFGLPIL